jgi:hypothetical protein
MSHGSPESDWKVFRELREVALERLCERILDEVATVISNSDRTHHQRFGELFGLIRDRNHAVSTVQSDRRCWRSSPSFIASTYLNPLTWRGSPPRRAKLLSPSRVSDEGAGWRVLVTNSRIKPLQLTPSCRIFCLKFDSG